MLKPLRSLINGSIASRLFWSAALWSGGILLIAGFALLHLYAATAEQDFDNRLAFYLKALIADVASPSEDTRTGPGQLGEPQFELSLSGWYWQIARLDTPTRQIKTSRSLFGVRLPALPDGTAQSAPGLRKGYVQGPDDCSWNNGEAGLLRIRQVAIASPDRRGGPVAGAVDDARGGA